MSTPSDATTATPSPAEEPSESEGGVLVVGAGIAGLACALALREAGVPVRVVDRGRRPGGRMSGRTLHGRAVDLGASYFTVPDGSGFAQVVDGWQHRGLAHPWTDTFSVLPAPEPTAPATAETKTGPMRYAAAAGLRSLVEDLATPAHAAGATLDLSRDITRVHPDGTVEPAPEPAGAGGDGPYDVVVLAMPEPQAARLLEPGSPAAAGLDVEAWEPALAIALGFAERAWPADLHGAFVDGSPIVTFLADDGDRRGDGAPVLVAHTTAAFAAQHLDTPDAAIPAVTAEVVALLGLAPDIAPTWAHAHRWTFARATSTHPEPYLLEGRIAVCGDAWGGRSSVSTAWASGDALGRALAARLRDAPGGDSSASA
ncbi:NAD(P)/FAD-dependent oxidoreductase [Herbiconiux liukaitaii]|uniref:NAD(P)/FAD-dependent oxidoreductase n=1 Tax=Herbiconiux liukaitaii TaxID=3342799 RepID=UPI0035B822F1